MSSFRVHENWKISKERVHLVVADNASKMQRAMKEGQFELKHRVALYTQYS